ncbi:MAG TPA: hypothetical protein VL251_03385, partial [Thermomonas sp.]|nr:hypothetical protein [Thermomonas sp.]
KASPPAAAPAAADSAARAATAARGREASAAQAAEAAVDAPGEDVPPATMDSPEARQAWLDRIDALLDQGRIEEARASLAEFRRRYPDAALPPELDALEP